MAEVIKMPKMSDTMTDGIIISWLKKQGDTVKSGDILAEVETDKATMELESYEDGVLLYVGPKEKEKVPVGGILAVVGKEGEDYKPLLNDSESSQSETSPTKQLSESSSNETDNEQSNNNNNQEESESTENTNQSQPKSKESSTESNIEVNDALSMPQPDQPQSTNDISTRIKASPLAKKVAQEMGYDISQIKGTGQSGRIIQRDVHTYDKSQSILETFNPTENYNAYQKETFEDISVSSMRSTIATNLKNSLSDAPHFYITQTIRMDNVVKMRSILNQNKNVNISYNDIIVKAVSMAIQKYPKVNVAWLEDKIRYNKHIHMGIAVAIDNGLVVPVLKFADTKSLGQISYEIKDLIDKAKSKKLTINDMQNHTFCISNLGMFGIDSFTSIINPPAACILAVGGIKKAAVIDDDNKIAVKEMMKVTLSCDHRVVDGAIGAQFLAVLTHIMEEPIQMLL